MSPLIFLAFKSLLHNKLIFALMVMAVVFGLGMQIPNSANLNGYTKELVEESLNAGLGHLIIKPVQGAYLTKANDIGKAAMSHHWARGYASRLVVPGILVNQQVYQGIRVIGIVPSQEENTFRFSQKISDGTFIADDELNAVIIGTRVAEWASVRPGEKVLLYIFIGQTPKPFKLTVKGILDAGFISAKDVFVNKKFLEWCLKLENIASSIAVTTENYRKAALYRNELKGTISGATVAPWWEESDFVANAISGNETIRTISEIMVIIGITIPVMALLYISVLHKRREIGIIAAIGFSKRDIFVIFFLRSLFIAFIGIAGGQVLGLLISKYFQMRPMFEWSGFIIKPSISFSTITIPTLIIFITTMLSGVYPAIIAS